MACDQGVVVVVRRMGLEVLRLGSGNPGRRCRAAAV